ncbi:(2Fe-2S) ferredoxin domain-containing protein [Gorillibacterium sp. sgz5001074]|uniref:(2Fe-2S) ferredoxin domain-containing protein n=1 Tax=Gorillibacterium sp. sgz5001074 TaxID=3446695 RepID=UPI003F6799A7
MALQISVCIGSSCHLKGAYRIIEGLEALIESKGLKDHVELKANFCAGQCQHAVAVKVGGELCVQVDAEELARFWDDHIEGRW